MKHLQVKHSYSIAHKRKVFKFLKDSFEVKVSNSGFEECKDMPWVKSQLHTLGLNIERVHGSYFVRMDNYEHMGALKLFIYLVDDGGSIFFVVQIMDIFVKPKWRRLGIGSQLIRLILHIATENSVKFVFGDLELKDDLEARKKFYSENGFQVVGNLGPKKNKFFAFKYLNGGHGEKPMEPPSGYHL